MKSQATSFEQDEFLKVPLLFRYGPKAFLAVGVLLSVLALYTGHIRIHEGRKAPFEEAFRFSAATADSVAENAANLLGRLDQTTFLVGSLQTTPGADDRVKRAFTSGLGLQGLGIVTIALTGKGEVYASTAPIPSEVEGLLKALVLKTSATPGGVRVLLRAIPRAGKSSVVPVLHRLTDPGPVGALVYLVADNQFSAVAGRALVGRTGWLQLRSTSGDVVLDVIGRNQLYATTTQPETVDSAAAAIASVTDYASHRMLCATAPVATSGLLVTVGIQEVDALAEFRSRIRSTWWVVGAAIVFVLGVVGAISLALRGFAKTEEYLRRLATVDMLTGLPNRRSFHNLLAKCVHHSKKKHTALAVFFIDLDNFKYVNDSMGHEAGDLLLKHIGSVLRGSVRLGDSVCRLAGDEFTVIAPGVSRVEDAQLIGERLIAGIGTLFELKGVELQMKASVGAALMPFNANTEEDLMRFADTAMYRAKQNGKGVCAVYDDSMAESAIAKAHAVRDLERAIARDELFLVYQPKFNLKSGDVTGYEALVRWRHPERGMVFPNDFVPLAEESGLIVELGNWVLRRALRQIKEWHDAGEGWTGVAVNVSALQLRGNDFVTLVSAVLTSFGIEGRYLQLELTESSLAGDVKMAQKTVSDLRKLGVSIGVDDFGTGYSSLGALQQFEIDCLKVDRSFVNVIETSEGEEICRAIVAMGHALQMRIVAEGAETIEQVAVLTRIGCDEVQGYYFAKPMLPELAVKTRSVSRPAARKRLELVNTVSHDLSDELPVVQVR